jgi:hypothetical protein
LRKARRLVGGLVVLAALGAPSFLRSYETTVFRAPSGGTLELTLRAWQPGEAILVRLAEGPPGVRTTIRFLGRDFPLTGGDSGGPGLALIGLDLNLKPGSYELEVEDRGGDLPPASLKRTVVVQSKRFPRKALTVKDEYVFYPPEVQERIRREAELVGAVYAVRTPAWLGDGAFEPPHPGPALPNFGELRIYNGVPRSPHTGVDIEAGPNEVVRAANAGRVALASELYLSGNTVIIDHGLGVFTLYCHFNRLLVKRGDAVRKGDPIGRVGSTGRSTGPHLHWGVRIGDARVDPASLLGLPF